jgi:hypothetical protein
MWLATFADAAPPPDVRKASGFPSASHHIFFFIMARLSLAMM